jgi:hypothetical protein
MVKPDQQNIGQYQQGQNGTKPKEDAAGDRALVFRFASIKRPRESSWYDKPIRGGVMIL